MSLKVLEQIAAPRLLVLLAKRKKMSITELRDNLEASGMAIYNAIKKLADAGLVAEERENHFPYRRWIVLTPLGQRVAEKLAEIETILAERGGGGQDG